MRSIFTSFFAQLHCQDRAQEIESSLKDYFINSNNRLRIEDHYSSARETTIKVSLYRARKINFSSSFMPTAHIRLTDSLDACDMNIVFRFKEDIKVVMVLWYLLLFVIQIGMLISWAFHGGAFNYHILLPMGMMLAMWIGSSWELYHYSQKLYMEIYTLIMDKDAKSAPKLKKWKDEA